MKILNCYRHNFDEYFQVNKVNNKPITNVFSSESQKLMKAIIGFQLSL